MHMIQNEGRESSISLYIDLNCLKMSLNLDQMHFKTKVKWSVVSIIVFQFSIFEDLFHFISIQGLGRSWRLFLDHTCHRQFHADSFVHLNCSLQLALIVDLKFSLTISK